MIGYSAITAVLVLQLSGSGVTSDSPAVRLAGSVRAGARFSPVVQGQQATRSSQNGAEIEAARQALAAGQPAEALRRSNQVLARFPADREAARIKVSALLAQQGLTAALAAYDAYVKASRKPDNQSLAQIARASLDQAIRERAGDLMFQAAALELLGRQGDGQAVSALKRSALAGTGEISIETLAPVVSLARTGDQEAIARLALLLQTAGPDDIFKVIQAIQKADARGLAPKVAELLRDSRPEIRGSAALALGSLEYRPAVREIRAMLDDQIPLVRIDAACALKRLGETAGNDLVVSLLKSETPEALLMAAEAYQSSRTDEWTAPVRRLLADPNPSVRVRAADLLARYDRQNARMALVSALDNQSGTVRAEAARVLEERGLADAALIRRMLADPFDWVRLHAARAAFRAASSTT